MVRTFAGDATTTPCAIFVISYNNLMDDGCTSVADGNVLMIMIMDYVVHEFMRKSICGVSEAPLDFPKLWRVHDCCWFLDHPAPSHRRWRGCCRLGWGCGNKQLQLAYWQTDWQQKVGKETFSLEDFFIILLEILFTPPLQPKTPNSILVNSRMINHGKTTPNGIERVNKNDWIPINPSKPNFGKKKHCPFMYFGGLASGGYLKKGVMGTCELSIFNMQLTQTTFQDLSPFLEV